MKTLAAWDRADFEALGDLAPEVGARIDEKSARAIDARLDELKRALKKPTLEARRVVVEALVSALASKDGFGFSASQGGRCIVCLALRQGASVLLDVAVTSGLPRTPASAWPELAPWKRAVHENLDPVRRWARKRERIELAAVAPSPVESTGPGLADLSEIEAAAIASPEADEPRAVLADALLSRGDPRGELFALQLRRAPYVIPSAAQRALVLREDRLVAAHRTEWTPKSLSYARSVTFRRGLIEAITVSGSVFEKHGASMVASAPVRSLRLSPFSKKTLEALLETSAVSAIRHLDLREGGGEALDVERIARSPHLRSLEILQLGHGAKLGAPEIDLLASSAFGPTLVGLQGDLTEDGALALARSRDMLPSLRRLIVGKSGPGHAALFAARALHALDVGACKIPLLEALAPPALERLVFLGVSQQGAPTPIEQLACRGAPPPRLAALSISSAGRLTPRELELFLTSPVFAGVRYLKAYLDLEPLDEAQAALILAHPSLTHLTLTEGALDLLSEETRARLAARGHYAERWALFDALEQAFVAPEAALLAAEALRDEGPAGPVEVSPPGAPIPATDLERASDPGAPPEVLEKLARGASEEIVAALLANPSAPPTVLDALSPPSASARVLLKVAQHPGCSEEILERLAGSKHKSVRAAAASHPRATASALGVALASGTIHEAMVTHPNAPEAVLRRAVGSADPALERAAAKATRLPDDLRAALLASERSDVVSCALERAESSVTELEAALDRLPSDPTILRTVAKHPACSAPLLERIARVASEQPSSDNALLEVATAASASAAALEVCAAHSSDARVHSAVARHPHAPPGRISALAETRPHDVAQNPSAAPELLAKLVAERPATYPLVAANPACPLALFRDALVHPDKEVRRGAARNPRLEPARIEELARHSDEHVRSGVAQNPSAPASCLLALARDPSPRVWLSLVRSSTTPAEVLEVLANGPAANVAAVARELPKR